MFALKNQAWLQTCQTTGAQLREWKNRGALEALRCGYAPQTVQNQFNPAQNTRKIEKEQGEGVLLQRVLSVVIWRVCWLRKRSPRSPARGRNITAIQVLYREYSHFFKPYKKVITGLPSSSWTRGKPLLVYIKNAFYGSNLNQSQMEASWEVKWGGLLPTASHAADLRRGHPSSRGAYRVWFPNEHIQEALA